MSPSPPRRSTDPEKGFAPPAQHAASPSEKLEKRQSERKTRLIYSCVGVGVIAVLHKMWFGNDDGAFLPVPDPDFPHYRSRAGDVLSLRDEAEAAARSVVYGREEGVDGGTPTSADVVAGAVTTTTSSGRAPDAVVVVVNWWGVKRVDAELLQMSLLELLGCGAAAAPAAAPPRRAGQDTESSSDGELVVSPHYKEAILVVAGAGSGYEGFSNGMVTWAENASCQQRGQQSMSGEESDASSTKKAPLSLVVKPVGSDFVEEQLGSSGVQPQAGAGNAEQNGDVDESTLYAPLLFAAANDILRPFLIQHAIDAMAEARGQDFAYDLLAMEHDNFVPANGAVSRLRQDSKESVPQLSLAAAKEEELKARRENRFHDGFAPGLLPPQRRFSSAASGAAEQHLLPAFSRHQLGATGGFPLYNPDVQFVPRSKMESFRQAFLPGWRKKAAFWAQLFATGKFQSGVLAPASGSGGGPAASSLSHQFLCAALVRRTVGAAFGWFNAFGAFAGPTHTFHNLLGVVRKMQPVEGAEWAASSAGGGAGAAAGESVASPTTSTPLGDGAPTSSPERNQTLIDIHLAVDRFLLLDHSRSAGVVKSAPARHPTFDALVALYESSPRFAEFVDAVRRHNLFYAFSGYAKSAMLAAQGLLENAGGVARVVEVPEDGKQMHRVEWAGEMLPPTLSG